jgi:hypothetical protein
LAAIQGIGSLVQGINANAQGASIEADQKRLRNMSEQQLTSLVNQVRLSEYDRMASRDINSAISKVSEAMSERGLGSGNTAALAGLGSTAAQVKSEYSRAYLDDKNSATQIAATGLANLAQNEPLGYNPKPFGGVGDGIQASLQNLFQLATKSQGSGSTVTAPTGRGAPVQKPAELGELPALGAIFNPRTRTNGMG